MFYPATIQAFNIVSSRWETYTVEKHTGYDVIKDMEKSGKYGSIVFNGKVFK